MIESAAPTPTTGFTTYKRVLRYVKPYWFRFVLAIVGMVMVSLSVSGFAWIMKPMLDGSFVERNHTTMTYVSIGIVALFIMRGIGNFTSMYFMAQIGGLVVNRIRSQIFAKYLHLPTTYYDQSSSGELISLVSYNVQNISNAASNALTICVRNSVLVIGLLLLMFYQSWQMALVIVVLGPIVGGIIHLVSKRFRRISRNIQTSIGQVSHVIQEAVEGQREIKIYGGQQYEQSRFDIVNERNRRLQLKIIQTRAITLPVVQLLIAVFFAAIVYWFGQEALQDDISVGEFVSFVTAMLMLFAPIRELTIVNETFQQGIAAGESVFAILDRDSEVDEGRANLNLPLQKITYERVSFRYNRQSDPILSGVSFEIKAGETVALVGKSGSGKTTVANLLTRMYQLDNDVVFSGEICINGVNINAIKLTDLRKKIAYVGQDIKLFNDTILHNIAYGALSDHAEDEVHEVAKLAHADGFIRQLAQGYQTLVGEDGVMLSGGQRQRIAIARAFLKNAPILILDEATSALDTESERKVRSSIDALLAGRTTLVIAHRLSTVEHADQIIVVDQGQIVEAGKHKELLANNGHYTALYNMQFSDQPNGLAP